MHMDDIEIIIKKIKENCRPDTKNKNIQYI